MTGSDSPAEPPAWGQPPAGGWGRPPADDPDRTQFTGASDEATARVVPGGERPAPGAEKRTEKIDLPPVPPGPDGAEAPTTHHPQAGQQPPGSPYAPPPAGQAPQQPYPPQQYPPPQYNQPQYNQPQPPQPQHNQPQPPYPPQQQYPAQQYPPQQYPGSPQYPAAPYPAPAPGRDPYQQGWYPPPPSGPGGADPAAWGPGGAGPGGPGPGVWGPPPGADPAYGAASPAADPAPAKAKGRSRLPLILGIVAVLVVAAVLVLGFVTPGFFVTRVFDTAAVQKGVSQILTDNYKIAGVTAVTCGENIRVEAGATFTCDATIDGARKPVPVTITSKDGDYEVGRPPA